MWGGLAWPAASGPVRDKEGARRGTGVEAGEPGAGSQSPDSVGRAPTLLEVPVAFHPIS